jgi:hypothetical protein
MHQEVMNSLNRLHAKSRERATELVTVRRADLTNVINALWQTEQRRDATDTEIDATVAARVDAAIATLLAAGHVRRIDESHAIIRR